MADIPFYNGPAGNEFSADHHKIHQLVKRWFEAVFPRNKLRFSKHEWPDIRFRLVAGFPEKVR